MENRERLEAHLARTGGKLEAFPDGPLLERFSAPELSQALESEVNRARGAGHTKIRIDMNFEDATALAAFLRRGTLLGA